MQEIDETEFILRIFQLRAARVTAGIELKTIGNLLGLTKAAISLWEHRDDLSKLTTSKENIRIMQELFTKHNIFFPDENSITLIDKAENKKSGSLTRFQLKAARTILNISQAELANIIDIPKQIITRAELLRSNQYIRPLNKRTTMILKSFFESKNIIFKEDLTVSFIENKKTH